MKEISRAELHEKLWSIKFMKLANELNLKDYTLRKICEDFNIPKPKSGYWRKLNSGKLPPISKLKDHEDDIVDLSRYLELEKSSFKYKLEKLIKEIKKQHSEHIIVPQRLRNKHPQIKRLRDYFSNSKGAFRYGNGISTSYNEVIQVSVTKVHYPRFLRIIETFVILLEARGHSIKAGDKFSRLNVNGEYFDIKFIEKSKRKIIPNDRWNSTTLEPTGKLAIKFRNWSRDKEWVDGYEPLEDKLARIVAYVELIALKEIKERIERDKRQAEFDRLAGIEREKQARIQ